MMESVFAKDIHGDVVEIYPGRIFNVSSNEGIEAYQYLGKMPLADGTGNYLRNITGEYWENVSDSWFDGRKIWFD